MNCGKGIDDFPHPFVGQAIVSLAVYGVNRLPAMHSRSVTRNANAGWSEQSGDGIALALWGSPERRPDEMLIMLSEVSRHFSSNGSLNGWEQLGLTSVNNITRGFVMPAKASAKLASWPEQQALTGIWDYLSLIPVWPTFADCLDKDAYLVEPTGGYVARGTAIG